MYSLSANFRSSRRADRDGSVFYTISTTGMERSLTSSIKGRDKEVLDSERKRIAQDMRIIYCVIEEFEKSGDEYSIEDILSKSADELKEDTRLRYKVLALGDKIAVDKSIVKIARKYARIDDNAPIITGDTPLTEYIDALSEQYCEQGRRVGKSLNTLSNSLSYFLKGKKVCLGEVDEKLVMCYHNYLGKEVSPTTVAFYMNTLRTVVSNANNAGLIDFTTDWASLTRVVDKPKTRVISSLDRQTLQKVIALDLSADPYLELIRDVFIFSFYAHGMELGDIATLKKENLTGNTLQYTRRAQGKTVTVNLGDKALDIINRHSEPDSDYLLPLLQRDGKQTIMQTARTLSYRALQIIGEMLTPKQKLSFAMTRTTWQAMIDNINLAEAII